MKIYTRTGDKGQTSLFDGTRVLKSHVRVDAYGTIDELNSTLGVALSLLRMHQQHVTGDKRTEIETLGDLLMSIQHTLFEIGSALAMPAAMPVVDLDKDISFFEKEIDRMTEKMPELKNFILPGGGQIAAVVHLGRAVSRRAERNIVALMQEEDVDEYVVKYINRLSDLLFTVARYANFLENKKEIIWKKR